MKLQILLKSLTKHTLKQIANQ